MSEQIEPGDGRRLIDKEKDTPKEGDEFWSKMFHEWGPLTQGEVFLAGYTYRRRIPAKPDIYHISEIKLEVDSKSSGVILASDYTLEKPLEFDVEQAREIANWWRQYADWREAQDSVAKTHQD
jgi:hypothetical protein